MLAATVHMAMMAAPSAALAQSKGSALPALPAPASAPAPAPATVASPATPRSAGDDVISLKNGGLIRGTIIEVLPDVQARVELVTGEIATIPWQQIDHIEHGAARQAPPSANPAPPPSEVWVHFEAPPGVLIQKDTTNDDNWVTVCAAPCDRPLPTGFYYRVTGGGIKTSADFAIHASPGTRETVVVDGASKSSFVIGVVGMIVGGIAAYVGLLVVSFSDVSAGFDDTNSSGSNTAGAALVLGGTIAAVAGLVLTLSNAKTKVNQDATASQAGLVLPGSLTGAPTWNIGVNERKDSPPALGIPIFSGRF
ncbi:MAG: hypothetical protein ACLP1X_07975 [Polyangiaceae bacterium]|jgi:hypothetical protein